MLDTIQATTNILQEKPATAQELLEQIQELLSRYHHALMAGYPTETKAAVTHMIEMVEWAGVQSEMMVTYPVSVSRDAMLKRLEFTVELKGNSRNIAISGMLLDSHYRYTTASFSNILFGEENGCSLELTTHQKRDLDTFLTILNEEGVLEMAR